MATAWDSRISQTCVNESKQHEWHYNMIWSSKKLIFTYTPPPPNAEKKVDHKTFAEVHINDLLNSSSFFSSSSSLQTLLVLSSLSAIALVISLLVVLSFLIHYCCCHRGDRSEGSEEEEDEDGSTGHGYSGKKGKGICCVTWVAVAAVTLCWWEAEVSGSLKRG